MQSGIYSRSLSFVNTLKILHTQLLGIQGKHCVSSRHAILPPWPSQTFLRTYGHYNKKQHVSKACILTQQQRLIHSDENGESSNGFPDSKDSTCTESAQNIETDVKHVEDLPTKMTSVATELETNLIDEQSFETQMVKKSTVNGFYVEPNVEAFLNEKDMLFTKGFTGVFTMCPKLGKLAMKRRAADERLYIDSISGYFHCSHCGKSGLWPQLRDHVVFLKAKKANKNTVCFKDVVDVIKDGPEVHPEVIRQLEEAEDFSTIPNETFDILLSVFDWNGIKKETFVKYGVKYKSKEDMYSVVFPIHSPTGSITSVHVYRGRVLEDGDIKTLPVLTYPRTKEISHLFGWQVHGLVNKTEKDNLVITTSEVNAMVVYQTTGVFALSLKSTTQLPQELLPHIENYSKIILWLGTDIKAWENTKIFAKKLNERRCYIYRPNALKYMPLEVLQRGDDIHQVLEVARLLSHKAIVTFENMRQEVFSEFAHYKQVAGVQWKRFAKLNQLLKGHRRGELTVLTGPTGSGKTTFMSEYSLDLCMQGVNTLWGSFEISNVRLMKMMMQQFAGKSIAKHLDEFDEIADEFTALPMYFMMYFGEEQISKVLEAMSHAVYVHDIGHVILDNLQFMMGMDFTEKNRFFRQDQIVAKFRKFATEKNCHVTLIIHPRKVNEGEELSTASIFGSAKITQEADNVLLIQDQRLSKPSGRKYLQIAKNRFDGDLGVMTLNFNKESLSFHTVEKRRPAKLQETKTGEDETLEPLT